MTKEFHHFSCSVQGTGKNVNEDAVVFFGNGVRGGAAVLDGVTGMAGGCVHGTKGYVEFLKKNLAWVGAEVVDHGQIDGVEIVRRAIVLTQQDHPECDTGIETTPQAALCIAVWNETEVCLLAIADCVAVVVVAGKVTQVFSDWRISLLRRRAAPQRRTRGSFRNSPDGFFTVAANQAVAYHAQLQIVERQADTELILCSDGLVRPGVDPWRLSGWQSLYDHLDLLKPEIVPSLSLKAIIGEEAESLDDSTLAFIYLPGSKE